MQGWPTKEEKRKYRAKAVPFLITGILLIIFYFCVKRYDGLAEGWSALMSIMMPFLIGFSVAFFVNPFMKLLERWLGNFFLPRAKHADRSRRRIRIASSIIAVVVLIAIIVLFLWAVVPQVVSTLTYIFNHLTDQISGVIDWADEITGGRFAADLAEAKKSRNIENFLDKVIEFIREYFNWDQQSKMVSDITQSVITVGKAFVAFLLGIVVAIYVLIDKEKFKGQTKGLIYSIFPARFSNALIDILRKAREVYYGFIVGKIIDSAIIGVLCYVCCLIFRFPYAVLVSVIVGVTNVIPVFGPYIGAVPTVIIIFFTNPMKGIYFLIFIIVLQQIDGNIIGPKILGDTTGISSFWVVVAIVVGGGLFGFFGMLLGVPTMALVYYICGKIFRHLARRRSLPEDTGVYLDIDHIDTPTGVPVMKKTHLPEQADGADHTEEK